MSTPTRTLALWCVEVQESAQVDPSAAARAFEPIVQAAEALTPRLELLEPGTLLLATRGPSRYWGGDDALAHRLHAAASASAASVAAPQEHSEVLVGIADGPFAALLAARVARDGNAGGVLVVPPGETPAFLAPLPVTVLGRPALSDVLVRLGLRTLGDFAALADADVLGRFGADGHRAHLLASGREPRPPIPRRLPPELSVQREIDPPATTVEPVAFVARAAAAALLGRLGALGLACSHVAIEVHTEHGEQHTRRWRHDGALSEVMLADRARWQLEGWLAGVGSQRPTAGVTLLRLVPEQVVPADGRQLDFWGGTARATERVARALARVQGLLGPGSVQLPVQSGGRHPAQQVTQMPLEVADALEERVLQDPSVPSVAPWPGALPVPSPATLHEPARSVQVLDVTEDAVRVSGRGTLSAPPATLVGERRHRIVAWAGPWLLDERWWDTGRRRQARLQVLTESGTAHLVVLDAGRWQLSATYD